MDEADSVFSTLAGYFAMLAEPARLKIMHAICDGERSVNEIVAESGVSQTSVSRHLALMHQHRLVRRRREGNQIYYGLADEAMPELCRTVCTRIASKMDEHRPLRKQLLKLIPARRKRAAYL